MLSLMLATPINTFVIPSIVRTAAKRNPRRALLAKSTDASFVVVETKAIEDMRADGAHDE